MSTGPASGRARGSLPRVVADALGRVCALIERDATGWTVGGLPAGASAGPLAEALYACWYTQPAEPPLPAAGDPPLHRRSLQSALRAAHARAGVTAQGWTVTASDPHGVVVAVSEAEQSILRPGEYAMPLRPGVPPAPGEPVEPIARLDHVDAERGLWWAFTNPAPEPPTGRVYLNARPATAPRAVHEVTAALAPFPYQLKCPLQALGCERVDAVVLYHARSIRDDVLRAIAARWTELGPLLDPEVPPLTCPLEPGLAWADDQGDSRSYGESRCQALAAAVDRSGASWAVSGSAERLAVLVEGLRAAGVDPERPWQVAP